VQQAYGEVVGNNGEDEGYDMTEEVVREHSSRLSERRHELIPMFDNRSIDSLLYSLGFIV
jgi:hypothetical protein